MSLPVTVSLADNFSTAPAGGVHPKFTGVAGLGRRGDRKYLARAQAPGKQTHPTLEPSKRAKETMVGSAALFGGYAHMSSLFPRARARGQPLMPALRAETRRCY